MNAAEEEERYDTPWEFKAKRAIGALINANPPLFPSPAMKHTGAFRIGNNLSAVIHNGSNGRAATNNSPAPRQHAPFPARRIPHPEAPWKVGCDAEGFECLVPR